MSTLDHEQLLNSLEHRVWTLERQIFGDDLGSKIQQQRKVPAELIQINSQIHRAVRNRENITDLMDKIEKVLELLQLEESSRMLGTEAKGNAILAAEPLIVQTYDLVQRINLDTVNEAMNSEAIRSLVSMSGQLSKLRLVQMDQEEGYEEICTRIRGIEDAINIVVSNVEYA